MTMPWYRMIKRKGAPAAVVDPSVKSNARFRMLLTSSDLPVFELESVLSSVMWSVTSIGTPFWSKKVTTTTSAT